jgi:hypothetical protein
MPVNQIVFKCDPEFKKLLQRLAAEKDRSVANFLKRAIKIYLREHEGIDWVDGQARPIRYEMDEKTHLRQVAENAEPYKKDV